MLSARSRPALGFVLAVVLAGVAHATDIAVRDAAELRAAVAAVKPGSRLLLAAGDYGGGFLFAGLRGMAGNPIVIAAADPTRPPVFSGAKEGLHLTSPQFVELHDLVFEKLTANGLNIDDGGKYDLSAHHVVLRGIKVRDIGTGGNHDGIKLSGLADFRIVDCTVERWGTGGEGIDMVGCHRGVIEGCTLRHTDTTGVAAVQAKGGSADIAIRRNRFDHAGQRAINLGGSTGLEFFRPPLPATGEHAEARDIRVEGNTFVGAQAPIAFVNVDGAVVRFNTIERPGRWAIRILQQTRAPGFVPCRRGEFSDNVVIFESATWASGGVNIGPGTAPETFTFARNWWYCADRPDRSTPQLPTKEIGGTYGRDPAGAKGIAGADAWRP
ncbi:MAG: right-handed parallel beta-helix repeat-containing protein [Verrucomicrobia bacterium]|nr:right-handed parallel beta-helix repeat-containing protein [Verrucomicrobiota bacterium]